MSMILCTASAKFAGIHFHRRRSFRKDSRSLLSCERSTFLQHVRVHVACCLQYFVSFEDKLSFLRINFALLMKTDERKRREEDKIFKSHLAVAIAIVMLMVLDTVNDQCLG